MAKSQIRVGGSKQPHRPATKKRKTNRKAQSRERTYNVQFQATVQNEHLRLQAVAPAKWLMAFRKCLTVLLAATVIKMLPDWWQALLTAVSTLSK